MLNLDPAKLLVIAVLAIVLLGPEKLPSAARFLGLGWRSVTRWRERMETEVRSVLPDLPSTQDISQMIRSPSALLDRLAANESPLEPVTSESDLGAVVNFPDDLPDSQIDAGYAHAPHVSETVPVPRLSQLETVINFPADLPSSQIAAPFARIPSVTSSLARHVASPEGEKVP